MTFDPTRESHTIEERVAIGDVPVTVRVTVQGGDVVNGFFTVDQGYGLGASKLKDVAFDKLARKALKEQPESVASVGHDANEEG